MKNKRMIYCMIISSTMLLTACDKEEKPLYLVPISGTDDPQKITMTTGETGTNNQDLEGIQIVDGSTITVSDENNEIEIYWETVSFQSEVHNTSDNKYKKYFSDVDAETYIVAKMKIKNVGGETVSYSIFDNINVEFDDKYNYSMQQLDLDSMVMSSFWRVQPLKTCDVYFVQSVPDEVTSLPYKITFTVGDETYFYKATSTTTTSTTAPDIRISLYVDVSELRRLTNEKNKLEDEYQTYLEVHGGIDNLITEDQISEAISILEEIIATNRKLMALVENLPKDLTADEEEYLIEVFKEIQG